MRLPIFLAGFCSFIPLGRADYLDDTGYRALATELGAALPDGSGVGVTQVEFGAPDYLPESGSGLFTGTGSFMAGKTFSAKSGASSASGHAFAAGSHLYSHNTNPQAGRATFTPGVSLIDLYRVDLPESSNSWVKQGWLKPGAFTAPLIEIRALQNHSWISGGSSLSAASDNDALRRFDFAIRRDGFLAVTGVNNGASAVPALMASAYNNLAVGLSSGGHSTGGVPSWLDGPGRQKPELVAPLDYTSFATALVSSAGALMRQAASLQGGNAVHPETLRAILLAGATKEEFPGWTRSPTVPLDPVFGAGELQVGHSWHILTGQEQAANAGAPRPDFAWSSATLTTSTTADYVLRIPPGSTGEAFSAIAAWNRIVTDTAAGSTFIMSVAPLANYQLSLSRMPASGSPVLVDQSISSNENVEHIYRRNLPSGTYRLRLSLALGSDGKAASGVPASLAWRLTKMPHRPGILLTVNGSTRSLSFSGLVVGQSYLIQSSVNPAVWNAEQAFTATGTTFAWSHLSPPAVRFYRLAATD